MATRYDPRTHCWEGPHRPPVLNPAANLGQVLLNLLERTPTKPAQLNADTGNAMCCEELRRRAVRFARRLAADGFQPGDVIALMARNSDDVAPVVVGCFLAGVTVSTLDPSFGAEEVAHLLRLTRPRTVIADADAFAVICEAAGRIGHTLADTQYVLLGGNGDVAPPTGGSSLLAVSDVTTCTADVDGEDGYVPAYHGASAQLTAAIVCSSGTTGLPKAVRISHAQLIGPYQRISRLDRDDTILCFSTLYWISGWQMLMTGLLNGVRRVITARSATPQLAIELCNRYRVTLLLVTPSLATDIVRTLAPSDRLASVKLFAVGGSTVSRRLREELNRRVLVPGRGRSLVGYGTSETGNIAYELIVRDDSVGYLLPGVTAKIVDEDGNPLGPNETGELIVRPSYPFLGYHGDESATREALAFGHDYVRTGDIARFDADSFLYLVDRKREIFKYDGFQIAPAELEDTIAELEGVRCVAVVGLPDPDRPFNELATAVIVREPYGSRNALTEQQVVDHCARTPDGRPRPPHKWLRGGALFVDELPMTASGKVRRTAAKQLAVARWNERHSSS